MHCLLTAICLALVTSACAGAAQTSPSVRPSITPLAAQPTIRAEQSTSPTPSAAPPASFAPTPAAAGLAVGQMASVVADSVVMRTEPGRQSAFVTHVCFDVPTSCPNMLLGPDTEYESVYLMDGPVEADGYDWYLAATHAESSIFPEYVGWIPVGDRAGPWVVRASSNCPAEPIELTDITYAAISRLELLACVGGRELTLYGWHPAPPPGDTSSEDCQPLEDREAFCTFGYNLLRPEEAPWAGSADHLPWIAESAANLPAPPRDAWITVRGRFDHPASSGCYDSTPASFLQCQIEFVVSSYSAD